MSLSCGAEGRIDNAREGRDALPFSIDDLNRYSRQMILPEVGGKGQERLRAAKVLLIGVGGLGCPAALYLAAAGVGTVGLLDNDPVELSNLHRQILHATTDIGRPKTRSAAEKLTALNPTTRVNEHTERLTQDNAETFFSQYDLVLDGSDNFETRYTVNDAAVKTGRSLVWGAVLRWEGQTMSVLPGRTACYRCLFPEPPDPAVARSCSDAGVAGPVAGVIGCLMATQALQLLLNVNVEGGVHVTVDFRGFQFRRRNIQRKATCQACGSLRV